VRPEGVCCSGVVVSEKTPLVIFGMAKVKRVRISALLSGLKLEADLENGQASATYRQKVRGSSLRYAYELDPQWKHMKLWFLFLSIWISLIELL